jgi:hypothetical protein
MICLILKEGKWAQHSRGNRAFGREVSDVVQSAMERKARELLRRKIKKQGNC